MRVFKAGDKYIAIHNTENNVYSATGKTEEIAKQKVNEMISKKQ